MRRLKFDDSVEMGMGKSKMGVKKKFHRDTKNWLNRL